MRAMNVIRRPLVFSGVVCVILLTGCRAVEEHSDKKAPATVTADTESHGLDLAGMDRSVKPGDDFFRYGNGTWLAKTEIPPDRSNYGSFAILTEEASKRTVDLIGNAAKSTDAEEKRVGDFYAAYMDETTIDRKGLSPLSPELARIDAISDKTALARFLGSQLRADVDALNNTQFHTSRLFGLWASPDFADPTKNVGYLLQGGIAMPDRENYIGTDEKSRALQQKYREHIAAALTLANVSDATARAARVYALEEKIARAHSTRTESVQVQRAQRWPLADFAKNAPGLDWTAYFSAAGLEAQPHLYVWQPPAFTGISAAVASEPLSVWKEYLTFHAIDRAAPLLSKPFDVEHFKFHGTALTGAPQQRERWKRGVTATNEAMGNAVGRMYVARYFPPEAKAAAQEMVKNIVAAFGARVDRLEWMAPATKEKAKAKLATMYVGIGYPEKWTDYTPLEISRDDALGNAERAALFKYRGVLAKLGQPVDKTEWWMTPQTVNAVNLPLQNAMNFPAAILNPPFFDAKTDRVQNYGGIGTVIGHEISHSFDDQGALFDAEGRLSNWWTKEDFAHFNAAGERLAAQYDTYQPLPGMRLNGKLTLSENIADVAGIAAAYDGYRASYAGNEAPASQGLSGDQRFFVSFAQIWRSKARPEAMRSSLITNSHSPGEFRAATVRNTDAWYGAFGVKPGDKLYLAREARIRVW
jgi:putative endopeptidase